MRHKKLFLMAAVCTMLTACAGNGPQPLALTESGLYITSEGVITSATIETYEADYYSEAELKASVEEILADFSGAETGLAKVKECKMTDGTAKLLIDFKTPDAYMDFMEAYPDEDSQIQVKELDVTTVSDGIARGYLVGERFYHLAKEVKETAADEVMKQSKLYVAAVEGPALIQTDDSIVYITTDVEVIGTNTVRTPAEGMSYIVFK